MGTRSPPGGAPPALGTWVPGTGGRMLSEQAQKWFPTHVQVTVLQARDLRPKGKSGTNDTYTIIQLGKEKYSTSVAEKSLQPVWKEEASFELPGLLVQGSPDKYILVLTLMHRSLVGLDKFLGQVAINLNDIFEDKQRRKTEWFRLESKQGKRAKNRGEIKVNIQFMRNNMTASMFDLSMKDKTRSPFAKLKDKMKGRKNDGTFSDTSSAIIPSSHMADANSEFSSGEVQMKSKPKKPFLLGPQRLSSAHSMSDLTRAHVSSEKLKPGTIGQTHLLGRQIEPFAGTDSLLDQETARWLRWDKNPLTLESVKQLIAESNKEELQKCFGARMEFGTAGLRAAMGAGFARMNDLTIIQTTQGFCRYLEKQFSDLKQRGVVISFDARAHPASGSSSKRFARLAATTFITQGIPVYLFSDITPTPFVPYTVLHLKLCAGIMITASHNPKQDDGYKVYWANGAQITHPHDKGISQAIEENLEPWPQAWDDSLLNGSPLLHDPSASISKDYYEDLRKYCFHRSVNRETKLKFVHTSVHGVGHRFVQSAFQAFDFVPPEAVPEQKDPDPEFPTVKYPNPEEGEGVLTLSFALADKIKAKVILANDPDADRLAVAEKQDSGEWRVFSGNELGALLGWWLFTCWKEKNQDPSALKDTYMLSSTVSSKILRAIALKEGFHFEETLTGFKWMGNRAKQLIDQGKNVLFAFEEAIGYMCCPFVLDKDGVSAAVISAELASFLATKNLSLSQQLKAIYVEYGYHITKASYFICHDQGTIKKLFENLRNYDGKNNYPKTCGRFEISGIRDLTTGYDDGQPDKKAVLPTSKSSQMITFTFANGCVATMRTSGTEPKIKYYAELCAPPGNSDPEQLKKELNELVTAIEEHFFQPQKYNLQAKAE